MDQETINLYSQPLQGPAFCSPLSVDEMKESLRPGNYLLAQIIDDFCLQLVKSSSDHKYICIEIVKKITEDSNPNSSEDHSAVIKHFNKLKAENTKIIFLPIHVGGAKVGHYFLIVVHVDCRQITVLDSLNNNYNNVTVPIIKFLQSVYNEKSKLWTWEVEYNSPQQTDGSSCGLFVIHHVIRILNNKICKQNGFLLKMSDKLREIIIANYKPGTGQFEANATDVYEDLTKIVSKEGKGEDFDVHLENNKLHATTAGTKNAGNNLPKVNLHKLDMRIIKMEREEINHRHRSRQISKEPDSTLVSWIEEEKQLKKDLEGITFANIIIDVIFNTLVNFTRKYTFKQTVRLDEIQLGKFTDITNEGNIYEDDLANRKYPVFCTSLTQTEDAFLKHFNILEPTYTRLSSILFIPIFKELYAITSGSGWSTLYRYADVKFHSQIPIRILDEDGAVFVNTKSVIPGSYRNQQKTSSTRIDLKNLEIGTICETFSAYLSDTINERVNLFHNSNICVDVGCSRLKFLNEITFTETVGLIYKLNYINSSPLYENLDSSINRLTYLVLPEIAMELDDELNSRLGPFLKGTEQILPSWVDQFDIYHKFTVEYTKSNKVSIEYGTQPIIFLPPNPSFRQICHSAKRFNIRSRTQNFLEAFKLAYYFGNSNEKMGNANLGDYLNGMFYYEKFKKHFWRIGKKWYSVSEEFIMSVQRRFQQILKDHLLVLENEIDEIGLFHAWPHFRKTVIANGKTTRPLCPKINEDEYNLLYKYDDNYYVGDKITPRTIEYFDILYNNEETHNSYLYHVKLGFCNSTRVACDQLRNSAEMLMSMTSETADSILKKAKLDDYIKKRIFTKDEILTLLGIGGEKSNHLVFVLGLLPNGNLDNHEFKRTYSGSDDKEACRSLYLEKDLERIIEETYISSYLSENPETLEKLSKIYGCQKYQVSGLIETALVEEKFISLRTDGKFAVDARLLLCSNQADFASLFPQGTKNLPANCKYIMAMLLRFTTYFDSFGAKLHIVRLMNTTCLNKDNFKIAEILSRIQLD